MIYQKIDWLSLIIQNDTPMSILSLLHCDDILDDLVVTAYNREQGYDTRRIFIYNGVCFDFSLDHIMDKLDNVEDGYGVFSEKYSKFRVDISGSGLDYLRDIGFRPEKFIDDLRNDFHPDHIRPTRIDYAFDFVNVNGDVLFNFLNEIKACEISGLLDPQSRLRFINGRNGGNNYSYRFGNGQQTFYFGTPRSESLLRIYDKRLQYLNGNKTFPMFEEIKHGEPIISWIRFELQTRSRFCVNFMKSFSTIEEVWKYISSNYRAINPASGFVFDSLDKFFGQLDEMKIVFHDYYNPITSFNERIDHLKSRAMKFMAYFYIKYGAKYFISVIQNYLDMLCHDLDPKVVAQRRAFTLLLAEDRISNGDQYAVSEYITRLSNSSKGGIY